MTIRGQWTTLSADDPETVVEITPGLRFPKYLEFFVTDEDDLDVNLRVTTVFDVPRERYVIDQLEARRRSPGDDITGTSMRSLRLQEYLRSAVRATWRFGRIPGHALVNEFDFELTEAEAGRIRALGPSSPEALTWTARIYKFAAAVNEAPAKAVQQQLGLTVPTASVWIRRARDTGVLVDAPGTTDLERERRAFETAREVAGYEDWPI